MTTMSQNPQLGYKQGSKITEILRNIGGGAGEAEGPAQAVPIDLVSTLFWSSGGFCARRILCVGGGSPDTQAQHGSRVIRIENHEILERGFGELNLLKKY